MGGGCGAKTSHSGWVPLKGSSKGPSTLSSKRAPLRVAVKASMGVLHFAVFMCFSSSSIGGSLAKILISECRVHGFGARRDCNLAWGSGWF